jgi:hypothetical protein
MGGSCIRDDGSSPASRKQPQAALHHKANIGLRDKAFLPRANSRSGGEERFDNPGCFVMETWLWSLDGASPSVSQSEEFLDFPKAVRHDFSPSTANSKKTGCPESIVISRLFRGSARLTIANAAW